MAKIILTVIILGVAFYSIVLGFRKGLTNCVPSLIATAFGVASVRIFTSGTLAPLHTFIPWNFEPAYLEFVDNFLWAALIYSAVYIALKVFCSIFSRLLSIIPVGMFNRIVGSLFMLFKNLLWLSLLFNLILCFSPEIGLLDYEKSNDGNLIAGILDLAHAVTGCVSADYLSHLVQLKEASFIS